MERLQRAPRGSRRPHFVTLAVAAGLALACTTAEPRASRPRPRGDGSISANDAAAGKDTGLAKEDAGDAEPAGTDAEPAGTDAGAPGGLDAGAGPSDGGAPPPDAGGGGSPRGLGTISNVRPNVACGVGGTPNGATCTSMTVSCPGIASITAVVAVGRPGGTSRGTIVAYQGSGGMDFYQQNIPQFVQNGFTTVQVRYDAIWQNTSAGILDAACRPATVLRWVFENVHNQSRTSGFCAIGHSGGSGQVAYLLAHYGMETLLDYASLGAGPPFARIDCGCAPQTCPGPHPLCPALPNAPVELPPGMDVPENTTTCRDPNPLPADLAKWAADSVVSSSGDFEYPNTVVDFYDCTNQPNGTTGGAYFYSTAITSARSVTCFTAADGCANEGVGTQGNAVILGDMLARCVPRH